MSYATEFPRRMADQVFERMKELAPREGLERGFWIETAGPAFARADAPERLRPMIEALARKALEGVCLQHLRDDCQALAAGQMGRWTAPIIVLIARSEQRDEAEAEWARIAALLLIPIEVDAAAFDTLQAPAGEDPTALPRWARVAGLAVAALWVATILSAPIWLPIVERLGQ
jgi:hypothetical protein